MVRASRRITRLPTDPSATGRWARVGDPGSTGADDPAAALDRLLLLLDRHGVVTRGGVLAEQPGGSFGPLYRAFSRLEETGQCLRGYFIEGLGAAQFSTSATVDRLRAQAETGAVVLAATDPANAYGAALPWPERATDGDSPGHRPGRKPGALVVLVNGRLVLYVERGARTLLTFPGEPDDLNVAAVALAGAVTDARVAGLTFERGDGRHIFEHTDLRPALERAGFTMTPQGLRLRS
jgi:ATP-dependent Lhr-like helicase